MNDCSTVSAPRVFISYAQHTLAHSARVLALALALRDCGIAVELDEFHKNELIDWPRWCQERLRAENSDWVLMICSQPYRDRFEQRVDPHTGRGAFWEGALIDDELYEAKTNRRFVPVLLDDEPEDAIPGIVRGWTWFRVRDLDVHAPGFGDLYRLLTGQPSIAMPPLGNLVDLGSGFARCEQPSVPPASPAAERRPLPQPPAAGAGIQVHGNIEAGVSNLGGTLQFDGPVRIDMGARGGDRDARRAAAPAGAELLDLAEKVDEKRGCNLTPEVARLALRLDWLRDRSPDQVRTLAEACKALLNLLAGPDPDRGIVDYLVAALRSAAADAETAGLIAGLSNKLLTALGQARC